MTRWDQEADVVIVGYGGAGAVTAITAHDAGAKVLILEKRPADTPTVTNHIPSTRMSGGAWLCPDDPEKATQYFLGLARVANESLDPERQELIRILAHRMADNTNWMKSIGAEIGGQESFSFTHRPISGSDKGSGIAFAKDKLLHCDFPELPGGDSCYAYYPKASPGYRNGAAYFKALTDPVSQRGIPVQWDTAVEHLVAQNGVVQGVIAQQEGKSVAIKARRAVVLTCGGFEFSDWLKEHYLRPSPIHFYSSPYSTGEGITMAQEVGAALWHMNCISCRIVIKPPDWPVSFGTQHHEEKSIFVDKRGNRFTNERVKMHSFGYELSNYDGYALCYPKVPCYWIFDEQRRRSGPLASYHGVCNPPGGILGPIHYIWRQDNLAEIDRGWIMKARTIEALAARIGADADNNGLMNESNMMAAVRRYNRLARAGDDIDFQRPAWTLAPLENPPYYAVKLWPGGSNTMGGPRRNKDCQVVHPDNSPIPRLYSCGELGSFLGMLYQSGADLGENIAFGRVAGENAAALKPWD